MATIVLNECINGKMNVSNDCINCDLTPNSEIDYGRHLTCESCSPDVTGGYDPSSNQLVICYNRCNKFTTRGVLAHELLHMWDVCRANLDFNNLEHVACTEVSFRSFSGHFQAVLSQFILVSFILHFLMHQKVRISFRTR